MGTCVACGTESRLISDAVGACVACLRAGDEKALETARWKHRRARLEFGLLLETPADKLGKVCDLCPGAAYKQSLRSLQVMVLTSSPPHLSLTDRHFRHQIPLI